MTQASLSIEPTLETVPYGRILVAVDSSDHANRAVSSAIALAGLRAGARVTGVHVYGAKMHDVRFRQMEGGLPEQYREESELERQRDVHDDLITRGLSVITDSYLDQAARSCGDAGIAFSRRSLEGKNYRELVKETNSGHYDLLVIGARGLGAIKSSRLGTVCERVVRRAGIDTLVIKDPARSIADGPVVVAVDGSSRAYGALLTALSLAQHWNVAVKVVAAFDPYFHYVAFNRIAGVLSEEAGKVFRFKEQEKLHEEIIDSGLAKIYQGHLDVAESVATECGARIERVLLDGKPHDAIEKYLHQVRPSLLVIGKLGIHADPELDIGGNAENLLRNVDCAVLLSQREHKPRSDVIADVTTSWTKEAEQRMARVPSFVYDMARMAILRYAQQRGHTVITERIVEEATSELMPSHMSAAAGDRRPESKAEEVPAPVMAWSEGAQNLLNAVGDVSVRSNLRMRAQKKARQAGARLVEREHLEAFLDASTSGPTSKDAGTTAETAVSQPAGSDTASLHWDAAALAHLMRVPQGFMREATRERIEAHARAQGLAEVNLQAVEEGLFLARQAMEERTHGSSVADSSRNVTESKCPFAGGTGAFDAQTPSRRGWTAAARERLENVPHDFCRDMTQRAAEAIAAQNGVNEIDEAFLEQVMQTIEAGSQAATETLVWDESARERIARAPDMVRGMLIREIEAWTRRRGLDRVDHVAVNAVKQEWQHRGVFHLDPNDPRGKQQ